MNANFVTKYVIESYEITTESEKYFCVINRKILSPERIQEISVLEVLSSIDMIQYATLEKTSPIAHSFLPTLSNASLKQPINKIASRKSSLINFKQSSATHCYSTSTLRQMALLELIANKSRLGTQGILVRKFQLTTCKFIQKIADVIQNLTWRNFNIGKKFFDNF